MLADNPAQRATPASENNGQSPERETIDELWDRILSLAGHGFTGGWHGDARTLATLILHYDRLQANGWPVPSSHVQPIPEIVDVQVDGDLL
jgi:hypothetical protein